MGLNPTKMLFFIKKKFIFCICARQMLCKSIIFGAFWLLILPICRRNPPRSHLPCSLRRWPLPEKWTSPRRARSIDARSDSLSAVFVLYCLWFHSSVLPSRVASTVVICRLCTLRLTTATTDHSHLLFFCVFVPMVGWQSFASCVLKKHEWYRIGNCSCNCTHSKHMLAQPVTNNPFGVCKKSNLWNRTKRVSILNKWIDSTTSGMNCKKFVIWFHEGKISLKDYLSSYFIMIENFNYQGALWKWKMC